MKTVLKAVLVCIPVLYSGLSMADDSAALKQQLTKIDGLKAEFSQTVTDLNDKVIQQGKGDFALAYPNQLYWHLTEPDESLIVADGKNLWVYNPFAEEVTLMNVDQAIKASPIALLVHRDDKTWSQYVVSKIENCYKVKPKATDAGVVGVKLCFKDNLLTQFSLDDNQGNNSLFTLKDQHALTQADHKIFNFKVPENVDVDDQRAPAVE